MARWIRAPDGAYSRFVSPIIGLVWVVVVSRAHNGFTFYCTDMGIMLLLRLARIQAEPVMTRKTIRTAKARARILFVLSGPLARCRKKARWKTICAKASTTNPTGMPGGHSKLVCDTTKEAIVARIASTRPAVYDR